MRTGWRVGDGQEAEGMAWVWMEDRGLFWVRVVMREELKTKLFWVRVVVREELKAKAKGR